MSNRSMPGLLKIGFSSKDPKGRAAELSKDTGVPKPFALEYEAHVENPRRYEQSVHKRLQKKRYGKEFFKCSFEEAIIAIKDEVGSGLIYEIFHKTPRRKKEEALRKAREQEEEDLREASEQKEEALRKAREQKEEDLREVPLSPRPLSHWRKSQPPPGWPKIWKPTLGGTPPSAKHPDRAFNKWGDKKKKVKEENDEAQLQPAPAWGSLVWGVIKFEIIGWLLIFGGMFLSYYTRIVIFAFVGVVIGGWCILKNRISISG